MYVISSINFDEIFHQGAIPWFRTYTSDSAVLYLVINLSIYTIVIVKYINSKSKISVMCGV